MKTLQELARHFQTTNKPYLFMNTTPLHLLGVDKYIPNLQFLCSPDLSLDYLRQAHVARRIKSVGQDGAVAFVFFDEGYEDLLRSYGVNICFPSSKEREAIEDKCECARIGAEAGVSMAPHVVAPINGYHRLRQLADAGGLGNDLVIQTPKGNSGRGTYFVSSLEDFLKVADDVSLASECRVMRRLRKPRSFAVQGVMTSAGVLVGMPINDLVGIPELTPNKGGWCGNELLPDLPAEVVQQMRGQTRRIGRELRRRKCWGVFEVDWLVEEGFSKPKMRVNNVRFQEINYRLDGATVLGNLLAESAGIPPFFVFHLAAYEGLRLDLDVDELNTALAGAKPKNWSVFIVKHIGEPARIARVARPGAWTWYESSFNQHRETYDVGATADDQIFWIPEVRRGATVKSEDVLGRVVVPFRITNGSASGGLNPRAKAYVKAVRDTMILTVK